MAGSVYIYYANKPLTAKLLALASLSIIISKTVDDKIYFRVRSDSGEILLTSREYSSLETCMNEIYGIQVYADYEFIKERLANGHRYTLNSSWGNTVGTSELYEYSTDMNPDIRLLKDHIGKASITDQSSSVRFFRKVKI